MTWSITASSVIWLFCKYILISVVLLIVYQAYQMIYVPLKLRWYYQKYPNVAMTDKFYPLLGDIARILQRRKENVFQFYDHIEIALAQPDKDIKLTQLGSYTTLDMISIKAQEELEQSIPTSIDRYHSKYLPLWYGTKGSFVLDPSTDNWKHRRLSTVKLISLNQLSKYLPVILRITDDVVDSWPVGEEIKFSYCCKFISFRVMGAIMFGEEIIKNMPNGQYIDPRTGETSMRSLEYVVNNCASDLGYVAGHPLGRIFPFIKQYPLVNPFYALHNNSNSFYEVITKIGESSTDKNGIYNQLMAQGDIAKIDVINDIIGSLSAGMDTTSDFMASTLYYLKKNPIVESKLMDELSKSGLDILKQKNLDEQQWNELYDKILDGDYLAYVLKETLRLNSPGFFSIKYEAKKTVKICDVVIPKGTIIANMAYGPSVDKTQWHKPTEYIPERFDPESEYFFKPGSSNKPRNPKSWVPFSSGIRTGPGKVLTTFETKVVIAKLLSRIDYDIDEDLLKNDKLLFNIHSQHQVIGKLLSK